MCKNITFATSLRTVKNGENVSTYARGWNIIRNEKAKEMAKIPFETSVLIPVSYFYQKLTTLFNMNFPQKFIHALAGRINVL